MEREKQKDPRVPVSTKTAILSAATELFSTKGFAGTSMSDLAQTLGLSKAAIYHHFEGKETIFETLLQSTYKDLQDLADKHKKISFTNKEKLEILREFAEFMFSHRNVVRLALSEMQGEVTTHKPQGHAFLLQLQQNLAGKSPTSESNTRARIALGIIFLGIVPTSPQELPETEDIDLELLLRIAADALGIRQ
jgi:AcrR family transcriptional regulator